MIIYSSYSISGCTSIQTHLDKPGERGGCGHSTTEAKYAHVNETMCRLGLNPRRLSVTLIDAHRLACVCKYLMERMLMERMGY